jgi:hypothetical protein
MRPTAALQKLRTNPSDFLKRYPILNTFDCAVSGATQAFFANYTSNDARRPGTILKSLKMHQTQAFRVNKSQFRNGEGDPFTVVGVYTGKSSTGPAWTLLGDTGPDIMLTAKLTGCTFVARAGGKAGQVEVAHLQPHEETGLQLHHRMKVNGQEAYGRLNYDIDSRSINVIGIRSAKGWEIYTQKLEKHHLAIRSVHRLFPA